ncbi:MAG: hypothetical protein H6Q90_3570 [Deltaproteobacteria bacterium]|nr:hypothetical protein [Deltaproteobacteria bacterium]
MIYEFAPRPIEPVRRGPTTADRSRAGLPRSSLQLDEAFNRAAQPITRCWKWASARGATPTTIEVTFTADGFGKTSQLSVTAKHHASAELVGCLQDTLRELELRELSARTTRMTATLLFTLADQPPWPARPRRPIAIAAEGLRQRTCTPILVDGPIDRVKAGVPLEVSDADASRTPHLPTVRVGCVTRSWLPNKRDIRQAFEANLGAYQRCYADARSRDPGLAGTVLLTARFAGSGIASNVTVSGAGEASFESCLVAAARDVWLTPSPGAGHSIEVRFPLALVPATQPTAQTAEALLVAGDSDAAIERWAAELATSRDAPSACLARVGILRALVAQAPWPDDARTDAALRELGAFAATMRRSELLPCIEQASDLIRELAMAEVGQQRNFRWSSLGRVEAMLPLAQAIDGALARRRPSSPEPRRWYPELRLLRAELLLLDGDRRLEAISELKALAATRDEAIDQDVHGMLDGIPDSTRLGPERCDRTRP